MASTYYEEYDNDPELDVDYEENSSLPEEEASDIDEGYDPDHLDLDQRPVVVWKKMKIGYSELEVSSEGTIRKKGDLFQSTQGFLLFGTPFRTYPVQIESSGPAEQWFVHDIVWRAFYGDPPEGWEVRHTYKEAKRRRATYSNALRHLTIFPIETVLRPTLPTTRT